MAKVAIIGGGWAGIAAAVFAAKRGHQVSLFEMAHQLGGRARSLPRSRDASIDREAADTPQTHDASALPTADAHWTLDNGQHILIGAYSATLALMRLVGVDIERQFLRLPLSLVDPAGRGLRLPRGPAALAFTWAVGRMHTWTWRERLGLLNAATGWLINGFHCPPHLTVAQLTTRLGPGVRHDLIDPLCVSALNTPSDRASATVFLRVLHDALFGGPGAADLLLPRAPLGELLPEPASTWLQAHGATLRLGLRVRELRYTGTQWTVEDQAFDRVILATPAAEAARLTQSLNGDWSDRAAAFGYEPIITVYLRVIGARLVAPMTALPTDASDREPAQFAFDHDQISHRPGLFAFVISGASEWVARGLDATAQAVRAQAMGALTMKDASPLTLDRIEVIQTVAERRATFACVPGLDRPPVRIANGLAAAGDFVEGPYPATLEGAVRSAALAVRTLGL